MFKKGKRKTTDTDRVDRISFQTPFQAFEYIKSSLRREFNIDLDSFKLPTALFSNEIDDRLRSVESKFFDVQASNKVEENVDSTDVLDLNDDSNHDTAQTAKLIRIMRGLSAQSLDLVNSKVSIDSLIYSLNEEASARIRYRKVPLKTAPKYSGVTPHRLMRLIVPPNVAGIDDVLLNQFLLTFPAILYDKNAPINARLLLWLFARRASATSQSRDMIEASHRDSAFKMINMTRRLRQTWSNDNTMTLTSEQQDSLDALRTVSRDLRATLLRELHDATANAAVSDVSDSINDDEWSGTPSEARAVAVYALRQWLWLVPDAFLDSTPSLTSSPTPTNITQSAQLPVTSSAPSSPAPQASERASLTTSGPSALSLSSSPLPLTPSKRSHRRAARANDDKQDAASLRTAAARLLARVSLLALADAGGSPAILSQRYGTKSLFPPTTVLPAAAGCDQARLSALTLLLAAESLQELIIAARYARSPLPRRITTPSKLLPPQDALKQLISIGVDPFAQQITLLAHRFVSSLSSQEFLGQAWRVSPSHAPNLTGYIEWFNTTSRWFATLVVSGSTIEARGKALSLLAELGLKLWTLRNFGGAMALLAALTSAPVARLHKSWAAAGKKATLAFEKLTVHLSSDNNYATYRAALAASLRGGKQGTPLPCVPYLGVTTTDLTFIDESNLWLSDSRKVNIGKLQLMAREIVRARGGAIVPYSFTVDTKIQQLLLGAEVWSDTDLYRMARLSEPPVGEAGDADVGGGESVGTAQEPDRGMTSREWALVHACAERREYHNGDKLYEQAGVIGGLYRLVSGRVELQLALVSHSELALNADALTTADTKTLAILETGALFGGRTLLDEGSRATHTAVAIEDVVCYVIEPSTIANVLMSSPASTAAFWRDTAHSMATTLLNMWRIADPKQDPSSKSVQNVSPSPSSPSGSSHKSSSSSRRKTRSSLRHKLRDSPPRELSDIFNNNKSKSKSTLERSASLRAQSSSPGSAVVRRSNANDVRRRAGGGSSVSSSGSRRARHRQESEAPSAMTAGGARDAEFDDANASSSDESLSLGSALRMDGTASLPASASEDGAADSKSHATRSTGSLTRVSSSDTRRRHLLPSVKSSSPRLRPRAMSTSPRTEFSPSLDKSVSKGSHVAKGGKSEHNTPRGTPTKLTPRKDASSEHDRVFQQLFDLDDDQVLLRRMRKCRLVKGAGRDQTGSLFLSASHVCFRATVLGIQSRLILAWSAVRKVVRDGRRIKLHALVANARQRTYTLQPAASDVDEAYRLIESLQSAAAKRDGSMRDTSTVSASKSMNGDTEPTAIEGEFTEGDTQTGFAGQLTIEDWSLLVKGARTVVLPPHAAVVSTGHRLARIYQVASGSCVFGTESAHPLTHMKLRRREWFGEAYLLSGEALNRPIRAGPSGAEIVQLEAYFIKALMRIRPGFTQRFYCNMARFLMAKTDDTERKILKNALGEESDDSSTTEESEDDDETSSTAPQSLSKGNESMRSQTGTTSSLDLDHDDDLDDEYDDSELLSVPRSNSSSKLSSE